MMTFLKHRSIAYTIFLGIFAVTILSTLFITFTVYSAFSDVLRQNEIKYNLLATYTIKHNFDLTINLIQRTADSLTSNSNITDCLQKGICPAALRIPGTFRNQPPAGKYPCHAAVYRKHQLPVKHRRALLKRAAARYRKAVSNIPAVF